MRKDTIVEVYTKNNFYGVQIKHIPTGITVICDSHNNQVKNRDVCLKLIYGLRRLQKERDHERT